MITVIEVVLMPESITKYGVKIEGYGRTSYTECQSEGQAYELAFSAQCNPVVAERLHGIRD